MVFPFSDSLRTEFVGFQCAAHNGQTILEGKKFSRQCSDLLNFCRSSEWSQTKTQILYTLVKTTMCQIRVVTMLVKEIIKKRVHARNLTLNQRL